MALYSQLFLRNTTSPYGDFTRNSVLSFKDLDQNFIFLKERDISNISYSSDTLTINTLGGNTFTTTISGGTSSLWSTNVNGIHYNSGNVGIGMSASSVNTKLQIEYDDASPERAFRIKNTNDGSQYNFRSVLSGGENLLRFDSDNTGISPLVVSSANKVGIGTNSLVPQATLHIYSTSGSQPIVLVEDEANPDATPFVIDIDGNVGIGTGAPNSKLEVSGSTGNLKVRLDNENGNETNQLLLTSDEDDYSNFMSIGTPTANAELQFGMVGPSSISRVVGNPNDSFITATSAADDMNFINNAGVGTTDNIGFYAGKTLGTDLSATTSDLIILGDGTGRGNVGLGLSNPSEKLEVSGNTKISGTLNIGTLNTGTSVNNLGIDSNGNVVSASTSVSTYWTSGSSGVGSIVVLNGGTSDSHGDYSLVSGYNNLVGNNVDLANYSSIIGGSGNTIDRSNYSSIIGGSDNDITKGSKNVSIFGSFNNNIGGSCENSVILGGGVNLFDDDVTDSAIIGGTGNTLNYVTNSVIVGGVDGEIGGSDYSSIMGGSGNTIQMSVRSGILNGLNNTLNGGGGDNLVYNSNIIGGDNNQINQVQKNSSIIAGSGNTIQGFTSGGNIYGQGNGILGGIDNDIAYVDRSAIVGGTSNRISAEAGPMNSVIAGGKDNIIGLDVGLSDGSFIGGGHSNTISGYVAGDTPIISSIIGGSGNTIDDLSNVHIIGCKDVTGTTEDTVYVPNLEVRGQAYTPIYDNLTGGTTFIPDWDNSNVQILTLSGNTNVSGGTSTMKGGSIYTMLVKQSNGGSNTITWDSTYKWEAGSPPTLTISDGSVDIITFICDGTSLYGLIAKDFQ